MEIQPQGLFTENVDLTKQLKDLYPASTYGQRREVVLHYLIALDQPFAQYINPTRLSKADPQNGLTPFHVAAMKGDLARAEILIKASDNPKQMINARDNLGWTPLHFAAVTSHDLFKRFLTLGGDPTLKTNKGADCDDLLKLTGRIPTTRPSLTESEFPKGFFFTDSPLYPKEKFHQLYLNDDKEIWPQLKNVIPKLYEGFRINPPPLSIEQCEEMKEFSPHFLDCKTKEKILRGSIIREYSGTIDDSPPKQTFVEKFSEEEFLQGEYYVEGLNARESGNEARFFNSGFPNAFNLHMILRGVKRCLVIALRDIEPGESIRWDYGIKLYPFSFGRCLLLGKEEMVSFFQKNKYTLFNPVKQLLQNFIKKPTLDSFLKVVNYQTSIHYVLSSPTAMIYLHLHNIINCEVWKKGIKNGNNNICATWAANNTGEYAFLLCIFDTLSKLEGNEAKQWAVQKLEKEPVINILKGLDLFIAGSSLQEIDQILAHYDWRKDPNYPFSIERRAQLVFELYQNVPKEQLKPLFEKGQEVLEKDWDSYKINSLVLKKLG